MQGSEYTNQLLGALHETIEALHEVILNKQFQFYAHIHRREVCLLFSFEGPVVSVHSGS